jgi:putative transposase
MSRCRTYRFLLQPTDRQRAALGHLLGTQCELYNAALEERRGAWGWERRSIPATPLPETGREVGIDLGVQWAVATSDGQLVAPGRHTRRSAERLAQAQRELASKRRGSGHRARAAARVEAIHRKVANQRKDFAHQLSRSLVNSYDVIVHEELKIPNMVRRPRPRKDEDSGTYLANGATAKAGLNRSIHDAGWGQLLSFCAYKAEDAGRQMIGVDPRYTSQRCSSCGHVEAANRRSQAEFRCLACGRRAQADVNAALNILWAGRALRGVLPVKA